MGEKQNRLFLMGWWCQYYNRPLKDPLLQTYTTEELAYEYYLVGERERVRQEQAEVEADRIEENKFKEALDWADEMEREEEEAERRRAEAKKKKKKSEQDKAKEEKKEEPSKPDPLNDPKQIEWMEEQIRKNKLIFGDDFGEDINVDFEDK